MRGMKMKLTEKIKRQLINPLQEKDRVMKLEYFLSNKYTIIGVILGADLFLLIIFTFLGYVLALLP